MTPNVMIVSPIHYTTEFWKSQLETFASCEIGIFLQLVTADTDKFGELICDFTCTTDITGLNIFINKNPEIWSEKLNSLCLGEH